MPQSEHALARHLPYVSSVGDDVIMLRDGDVMASFLVTGLNADTADPYDVDDLANAMADIVAQSADDVAFYVHRIGTTARPRLEPIEQTLAFEAEADRRWQASLKGNGLRLRRTMVTAVIRPSRIASLWGRFISGGKRDLQADRDRRVQRLTEVMRTLMDGLRRAGPVRLSLSDGEWLGLLRTTASGLFYPTTPGETFMPLADLVSTSRVDFAGDTFLVHGGDSDEMRFGAVFSLKKYPGNTYPGVFDPFDQPFDTVVTHSFTPTALANAQDRIQRTIRQMSSADDAAITLREQLIEAADDLASGRVSFGMHHATVTVFARTEAELDDAAARVRGVGQRAGAVMVREQIGARAAYFAQHPGNFAYRARAAMVSSRNFGQMAALHGPPRGLSDDRIPWGKPVTILPTASGEPFRFNFHLPGSRGERTVGHSLIIGMTGAGKTLGAAFLLSQARRLGPRIIVFDKDQGFEMAIRAMGGDYSNVRMGVPTGFNPFRAEADDRGTAWLTDWVSALMAQQGSLTATQREAIGEATRANLNTDPALQNLSSFRAQFRATDDNQDLFTRLSLWDAEGQFGWLFAGEGQDDTLSFANDVTAFDLTEIFDSAEVRTAWLSYVFRRIERTVEDERPTIIVLDEAWKLLDDPYFEARLKDWMLTMRKKNVAVVLMTQRVAHILESKAGGSIIESTVTQILYPNAKFTAEELAPLNLTEGEVTFMRTSGTTGRYALIRSGDESVLVDMDLSDLGGLLRVLGGGKGESAPAGWRDDPEFWKDIA